MKASSKATNQASTPTKCCITQQPVTHHTSHHHQHSSVKRNWTSASINVKNLELLAAKRQLVLARQLRYPSRQAAVPLSLHTQSPCTHRAQHSLPHTHQVNTLRAFHDWNALTAPHAPRTVQHTLHSRYHTLRLHTQALASNQLLAAATLRQRSASRARMPHSQYARCES